MDKVQLHLTPLSGYTLKQLSFANINSIEIGQTYFIFWTYGYKAPAERRFWILLERASSLYLKLL